MFLALSLTQTKHFPTPLQQTTFENMAAKGEIPHNEQIQGFATHWFLLYSNIALTLLESVHVFKVVYFKLKVLRDVDTCTSFGLALSRSMAQHDILVQHLVMGHGMPFDTHKLWTFHDIAETWIVLQRLKCVKSHTSRWVDAMVYNCAYT